MPLRVAKKLQRRDFAQLAKSLQKNEVDVIVILEVL
jgi:hypothetical protein